jgi:CcmD family protein
MFNKINFSILALFLSLSAQAQQVENDFYRSNGKIYVVVAVVGIIFAGIIAYLIYMDSKIAKLEKQVEEKSTEQ